MKKLLVIRFSALGDITMSVPVVHDLAVQYPDLDITMLSREMARPLFECMPSNVHFFAADLNGDSQIDIADVAALITILQSAL